MATSIRQALHTYVEGLTAVTTLLASGASSVLPWGRASPSTPAPFVVIRYAGRTGGPRSLPFYTDSFMMMVYGQSGAAQMGGSYDIDPIIRALRSGLNGASLTVSGVSEQVFQCHLDNYGSPDQFDFQVEKPYQYFRLYISGAYTHDYR